MRVTVVATGIGAGAAVKLNEPKVSLVQRNSKSGEVDYEDLDRPTVIRKQGKRVASGGSGVSMDSDLDYLDVPAFLRRQAD
jgi:cell division protein FtsZ